MKNKILKSLIGITLFWAIALLVSSWGLRDQNFDNKIEISINDLKEHQQSIIDNDYVNELIIHKTGNGLNSRNHISNEEVLEFEGILNDDPFIRTAKIYYDQSGVLHFDLQTKEPIARVIDRMGKNYYITFRGNIVPFSYSFSPRVVVITGYLPELSDENWSKLVEVIRVLDSNEFIKAQMESIFITKGAEMVMTPKVGDFRIKFGKMEYASEKFKKLQSFYEETYNKIDWSKYSDIVLDYEKQIILKKEKNRA